MSADVRKPFLDELEDMRIARDLTYAKLTTSIRSPETPYHVGAVIELRISGDGDTAEDAMDRLAVQYREAIVHAYETVAALDRAGGGTGLETTDAQSLEAWCSASERMFATTGKALTYATARQVALVRNALRALAAPPVAGAGLTEAEREALDYAAWLIEDQAKRNDLPFESVADGHAKVLRRLSDGATGTEGTG
jgi:hypothetical protein